MYVSVSQSGELFCLNPQAEKLACGKQSPLFVLYLLSCPVKNAIYVNSW